MMKNLDKDTKNKLKIPFAILPQKQIQSLSHVFFGISVRMKRRMGFLENWLYRIESEFSATEYLNIVLFNSFFYFFFSLIIIYAVSTKAGIANAIQWTFIGSLGIALTVMIVMILYPKWIANKKVAQINKDLLFAARHLRVQTTAGVPLFDSLVSASEGYGAVSEEFRKIVINVQSGANLAEAIEESARRNPSYYYSRILWQLSNAVKAGTDVGPVLSEIVDFLAEEQRIEMRNYGAQLNTLAILYLMVCIIVPTVSLIFLMIISSFSPFPITDIILFYIIGAMIFIQYMFIGLIESRRPAVSI